MDVVFDNVSFTYANGARALDGVSLEIPAGQFVAVVGANGSGKSTFAKLVNALYVPATGRVLVGGMDTSSRQHVLEVRSRVGMVFQNPDNQAVASVVEDDVAFGPQNLGLSHEEIGRRVHASLERVHMLEHAKSDINALSGGQKQLVAIAGTLAMEPEVVVLDEPGAMLDVRSRAELMRVLHDLNAAGMTVVLVTHFMDEALEADRVIVLDRGTVALDGAPHEVFCQGEQLAALGLELPFAYELSRRLLEVGVETDPQGGLESMAAQVTRGATVRERVLPGGAESAKGTGASDAVVLEDVTFSYDENRTALADLNLSVHEGDFLGLIGSTGSGKSTLAQLMNGLLVPQAGRVEVFGASTGDKRRLRGIRKDVGLVFQYPEQQLFATTVAEDVAFGPHNLGLASAEIERQSRAALEAVGLPFDEYAQRSPFSLSGGEQRRVALAGVLAMQPRVLVLDEPAAGMDPQTNAQIKRYLCALNGSGMTIVVISHSMDDVAQVCGRVVCLDGGRIVASGAPADVLAGENAQMLRQIGLGVPHAAEFAIELARQGLELPERVLTVDQLVEALAGPDV